mgnify:CR=1 FL=1
MNSSVKESWVSEGSRGADAYEAWVDKLMTAQGADWCPGKTPPGAFNASLRHKVIGEINVFDTWQVGDRPQGVAGDCNSLAETHARFDS